MDKLLLSMTFDYEIYFGKNYEAPKSLLFDTSQEIASVLTSHGVDPVWFVDIMSFVRHCELFGADHDYCVAFAKQIKDFVKAGGDIQFHLHPHWEFSEFRDGEWVVPPGLWSLGDVYETEGEAKALEIWKKSVSAFKELVGEGPLSFRAGGYSLQKRQQFVLDLLKNEGIHVDSSVYPGRKQISDQQNYDYLNLPGKSHWRFNRDEGVSHCVEGPFVEAPIASVGKRRVLLPYLKKRLRNTVAPRASFKGKGVGVAANISNYQSRNVGVTFDRAVPGDERFLFEAFSALVSRFAEEKYVWVNILSHPKAMDSGSISAMRSFLDLVHNRWGHDLKTVTHKNVIESYIK